LSQKVGFTRKEANFAVFSVLALLLMLSLFFVPTVGSDASVTVGENSLPLSVYIVSLPDVGNYRASNNSKVVEGALEATKVKRFGVFLDWDNVVYVNVSITAHIVSDWEAYRMLIEWGNNVIVVNTHDEYLPVPLGYTKEEWVDNIADFMLNRWGTWTHLGGYPFYRVWYQNGTREEWGEQGFKKLMSHIGRGNITCYTQQGQQPDSTEKPAATFITQDFINWHLYGYGIGNFAEANPGYPINANDFKENFIQGIYGLGYPYRTGATIRFTPNQTTFNFGMYVHLSAWKFYDINGIVFEDSELAQGFISSAAAIWADIGYATFEVYGTFSDTPRDAIKIAKLYGRTIGLDQAEEQLQKSIDSYNARNYKMAVAYATQAKLAAQNATQPNQLPQIIAGITIATITIGVGAYYKIHNKNKRKES